MNKDADIDSSPDEFQDLLHSLSEGNYNQLAKGYDDFMGDKLGYQSPKRVAELLGQILPQISGKVLDLGCGTGLLAKEVGELPNGSQFLGVDLNQTMLGVARSTGLYQQLIRADASRFLPFGDRVFPLVVSVGLMEHIGVVDKFFQQVNRVMILGGIFVFTFLPLEGDMALDMDPVANTLQHHPKLVETELTNNGFELVTGTKFPAYRNGTNSWLSHLGWIARKIR